MNLRSVILGILVGSTAIGVGSAVVGVGPLGAGFGSEEPRPPALLAFETASVQCTDGFVANGSTVVATDGPNTLVTYARNVSLPGPTESVGGPTFERRNDTTYELTIPTEQTQRAPRNCSGVARYDASMRIPAGDEPWRIVVQHDDETVTTLEGDADSTSVSGSASSGQRVSQ